MPCDELVVVIPCHRRWDLLPQALAAVAPLPVIVVDDSPPSLDVQPPPGVTVVATAGSQGFAAAVNVGLAAAQAAGAVRVLLLNDDAAPAAGCVAELAAAWGPGIGAVGPVILGPDGAIESAGARLAWWGRARLLQEVPPGPVEVDALSGACVLVSSSERLDEGFAHGFEDFALCQSLRRRGQRVVLVPSAVCVHLGGATVGRRSRRAQRAAVSGHLRLVGRRRLAPVVVALACAQVIREGGPSERLLGIVEGVSDWWRSGRGD
ncbi:MAG: GT2 family glycosyltransferase [Myxococcota bacterium]|jgi:GT2 family glycosyltransferase